MILDEAGEQAFLNGSTTEDMQGTMDPMKLFSQPHVDRPEMVQDAEMDEAGKRSDEDSEEAEQEIDTKTYTPLRRALLRSGLCYDHRMRAHETIDERDRHPENSKRIFRIYQALIKAGLTSELIDNKSDPGLLVRIPVREATRSEIIEVHDPVHLTAMLSTARMTRDQLLFAQRNSDSMYFNNESVFCAFLSCGGTIETCFAVAEEAVKNAIAVVRPPGHHAEPEAAGGFCLFNNVAVATKATMNRYPSIQKIMILDWDVHHGNGTQRTFYNDPNVLYVSVHRFDNGKFYPGSFYGHYTRTGGEDAEGYTVNVPWPSGGMGDGDYMHAFHKLILPIAYEFNPDLVIISAGFDAAAGDEIGECFVSPACYAHMTKLLMGLAEGKLVVALEGGYNLDAISESALAVAKTLVGEPPGRLSSMHPSLPAIETVEKCLQTQSKYWNSLRPKHEFPDADDTDVAKLDDVLKLYQSRIMMDRFGMAPLPIYHGHLSKYFQEQAMCTPNFYDAKTLMLLIHYAPDTWSTTQGSTNVLNSDQSYVVASCNQYVGFAVEKGFGVLDVTVPSSIPDESESFDLIDAVCDLCIYLWDNYLELSSADNILLIGVGELLAGLTNLVSERDITNRAKCVIGILGLASLQLLEKSCSEEAISWYYQNSVIYAGNNHAAFLAKRKIRKRAGRIIKSPHDAQSQIMLRHFKAITTWAMKRVT